MLLYKQLVFASLLSPSINLHLQGWMECQVREIETKKGKLHELPYTKMVNFGTNRPE